MPYYLFVDDDEMARHWFRRFAQKELSEWTGMIVESPKQALKFLRTRGDDVDLVIADYKMPDISGLELFRRITDEELAPRAKRILISAFHTEKPVTEAVQGGLVHYADFDFLPKKQISADRNAFLNIIRKIMSKPSLPNAMEAPTSDEDLIRLFRDDYRYMVGKDTIKLARDVLEIARGDPAVLIRGEPGVGKDTIAHVLHGESLRKDKPFVALNCAALSKQLVESELFGHVKGAFTDATAERIGRFKAADGGTFFLDEVGELAFDTQAKLLRVLQTGQFERVGSTETLEVDVRIISATNCDLARAVNDRRFREDLYWRLAGEIINIQPLRERPNDLIDLVVFFLQKENAKGGQRYAGYLTQDGRDALCEYRWPGNIRQLEKAVGLVYRSVEADMHGNIWLKPDDLVAIARTIELSDSNTLVAVPHLSPQASRDENHSSASGQWPAVTQPAPFDYVQQVSQGGHPTKRDDLALHYGSRFVLLVYALLIWKSGYHHPSDETVRKHFGDDNLKAAKRWVELNWKKLTGEANFTIPAFIEWAKRELAAIPGFVEWAKKELNGDTNFTIPAVNE